MDQAVSHAARHNLLMEMGGKVADAEDALMADRPLHLLAEPSGPVGLDSPSRSRGWQCSGTTACRQAK